MPSASLAMASGWSPVGLKSETMWKLDVSLHLGCRLYEYHVASSLTVPSAEMASG